jgi:hypothetical protein
VAVDEAVEDDMVPRRTGDPFLKEHLVSARKRAVELLGSDLTLA